jgi:phage tail sheath gpL-like
MPIDMPKTTLSIIPAQQLAGVTEQRVLIVGQMLAGGTATAGELQRDIGNDGSEDALFDENSHIAGMIAAFKKLNKVSNLDAIGLDDAGTAVKATAVITFSTGPATAIGKFIVTIASEFNYQVTVDVSVGDTVTVIGDAVVAAFDAIPKKPFTIANVAGVVTATAENGGTLANDWGISVSGSAAGVTVALTSGWSAGATDPTLTGVLDVIGDRRYQTILWPSAYALDEVETLLNARFNASNDVLDGVAIQVKSDTLANLKAYAIQNSQSVVIPGVKKINGTLFKAPATFEMPDIAAAQICAIRALRLTQGAVLTQFQTTVAADDQFGGISIASLPYFNTALPNLSVSLPENDFSKEDVKELIGSGVATFGPNRVYNATIFGEFVTTYLTDAAANADDSFKFLNTVDTASVIREFYFVNLKKRYAQTRLTDGNLVAGRDMANEASIRTFCAKLYDELADDALVQKGTAAKKDYLQNLSVVVDVRNGKATINQAPLLVSQLRVILGTIQINFGD